MPPVPPLSLAYPLILGAAASFLLVAPIGIGGDLQYGAWLYVGIVIAAVTFAIDRLLQRPFGRLAPPRGFMVIPIAAGVVGILAGWLAVNYTMGGPV